MRWQGMQGWPAMPLLAPPSHPHLNTHTQSESRHATPSCPTLPSSLPQTVTFYDSKGEFAGVRRLGSGKALEVEGMSITPELIVAATGLELKADPGVPLVYAGFGGEWGAARDRGGLLLLLACRYLCAAGVAASVVQLVLLPLLFAVSPASPCTALPGCLAF